MFSPKKLFAKISNAAKAMAQKLKAAVPRASTQAASANSTQASLASGGTPPRYEVLYDCYEGDVDPLPRYVRDAHEDVNNYMEAPPYTIEE